MAYNAIDFIFVARKTKVVDAYPPPPYPQHDDGYDRWAPWSLGVLLLLAIKLSRLGVKSERIVLTTTRRLENNISIMSHKM